VQVQGSQVKAVLMLCIVYDSFFVVDSLLDKVHRTLLVVMIGRWENSINLVIHTQVTVC